MSMSVDDEEVTKAVNSIPFDPINIDGHIHCTYCFYVDCLYQRCGLRACHKCLTVLHSCELEDYLLICAKAYVSCLCATLGCPVSAGNQKAAADPIILQGKATGQQVYFHTAGYESGRYANNLRCSWILIASSSKKRIMLTVHDSDIDDALFSECDDYCSIHDGDTSKSPEVVRWCGGKHPDNIISTTDSLYVHFHSDEAFQGRGINMSFIEFDMPGCPPSWISSYVGYCYLLKKPIRGSTWLEAQKGCNLVRSNLLTWTSSIEYSFIKATYTKSKTLPWIGYVDYSSEGRFMPVDPNSGPWPEDLPKLKGSPSGQQCALIDWQSKKQNISTADDCRNRHEYICKRRKDGTTIPYLPQEKVMHGSVTKSPISFTTWLPITLLALLALILLWLCYRKCKKQHALSRIGSSDVNQRLVTGVDVHQSVTSTTGPKISSCKIQKTSNVAINNDGANKDTKLTTITENARNLILDKGSLRREREQNTPNQNSHSVRQLNLERIEPTVLTIKPRFNGCQTSEESFSVPSRSKQNLPFVVRESTIVNATKEEALVKIQRGELFERPRVSVLDHTSAISLDEFWNKNEM